MGLLSGGNITEAIAGEAAKAHATGLSVYTPRLVIPPGLFNKGSGHIPAWAEMVQAIEAAGWQLVEWSVTGQGKDAEAYPLFRRV